MTTEIDFADDDQGLPLVEAEIRVGHADMQRGLGRWRDGVMRLAGALLRARDLFQNDDRRFGGWLAGRKIDFVTGSDRAALLNLARHETLAVEVLQRTKSVSVQLIWRNEVKPLVGEGVFASASKDPSTSVDQPDGFYPSARIDAPTTHVEDNAVIAPAEVVAEASPKPRKTLNCSAEVREFLDGYAIPRKTSLQQNRLRPCDAYVDRADSDIVYGWFVNKHAQVDLGAYIRATPKFMGSWFLNLIRENIEHKEIGCAGAGGGHVVDVRWLYPHLPKVFASPLSERKLPAIYKERDLLARINDECRKIAFYNSVEVVKERFRLGRSKENDAALERLAANLYATRRSPVISEALQSDDATAQRARRAELDRMVREAEKDAVETPEHERYYLGDRKFWPLQQFDIECFAGTERVYDKQTVEAALCFAPQLYASLTTTEPLPPAEAAVVMRNLAKYIEVLSDGRGAAFLITAFANECAAKGWRSADISQNSRLPSPGFVINGQRSNPVLRSAGR